MLINENYSDIFPFAGKILKCAFNGRGFGLVVNDKKVALRVWGVSDVLFGK